MLRALLFLNYRRALNLACGVFASLWIGWCLYWPFFTRHQDIQQADTEAAKAYAVCLQQPALGVQVCRADRENYQAILRNAVAPPGQNAYQVFAGEHLGNALAFMSTLCLLPALLLFAVLRLLLEICLFFGRLGPQNVQASR